MEEITAPRKLSSEETCTLRSLLHSKLSIPSPSSKNNQQAEEDASDLLDYAFAMISNGKNVQYVINELSSLDMEICDGNCASMLGDVLVSYFIEMEEKDGGGGGRTTSQAKSGSGSGSGSGGKRGVQQPSIHGGNTTTTTTNNNNNALTKLGALGASRVRGENVGKRGGGGDNNKQQATTMNSGNNANPSPPFAARRDGGRGGRGGGGGDDGARGGGRGDRGGGRGVRSDNNPQNSSRSLHGMAFDRLTPHQHHSHSNSNTDHGRHDNLRRGGGGGGPMPSPPTPPRGGGYRGGGTGRGGGRGGGATGGGDRSLQHHDQGGGRNSNRGSHNTMSGRGGGRGGGGRGGKMNDTIISTGHTATKRRGREEEYEEEANEEDFISAAMDRGLNSGRDESLRGVGGRGGGGRGGRAYGRGRGEGVVAVGDNREDLSQQNYSKRPRHHDNKGDGMTTPLSTTTFDSGGGTGRGFYRGSSAPGREGRGGRSPYAGRGAMGGRGRGGGRGGYNNFDNDYSAEGLVGGGGGEVGGTVTGVPNATVEAAAVSESPLIAASFGRGRGRGRGLYPYSPGRAGRGSGRGGRAGRAEVVELISAKTWKRPRTMDEGLSTAR